MSITKIFLSTFFSPASGLTEAADSHRFLPPLIAATLATLLAASVLAPRLDVSRAVEVALERDPEAARLSVHDREVKFELAQKLAIVSAFVGALVGPTLLALAAAIGLFLAFRLAGAHPPFSKTLAVTSWGLLPLALKELLLLPALIRTRAIEPDKVPHLMPSSLEVLFTPGTQGPLVRVAGAIDLFWLWAAILIALGMTSAAKVTSRRAFTIVLILWSGYVLLYRVALPGFTSPSPG